MEDQARVGGCSRHGRSVHGANTFMVLRSSIVGSIGLASLLASVAPASAQSYEGPRLLGVAEAQRALVVGNDAIYVNPAGLALAQIYSVEVGYLDDLLGSDRRINASVVDGQSGPVAGGFAYTYVKRAPDAAEGSTARLEGHRTEMVMATRIGQTAAIGLTGRYVTFERRAGEEDLPDEDFKSFQIDAGFQWQIWQGFSVGVAGYNLTKSEDKEFPRRWGAGIGYRSEWFSLESDVRYSSAKSKPDYSLGGEVVVANFVALRAGGTYNEGADTWSVSGGAGIIIDRLSIDIGYRQRLKGEDLTDYGDERILGVGLRLLMF